MASKPVNIPQKASFDDAPTPFQSPVNGGCYNGQLEDTLYSTRIVNRQFAQFTPLASPETQASVSSKLNNLTGFRNHNGRYCMMK